MVARITPGYSIRRAFHYNENKLKVLIPGEDGKKVPAAKLLQAANYPMDMSAMKEGHRINMLLKLAERNTEVRQNSIHISLNFSNKDTLTDEQMSIIAEEYMDGIGYGKQPYLVYRHLDSGHPHLHIVTVKVDHNGERIETQDNFWQSEIIRKEIEHRHNLTPAEQHRGNLNMLFLPKPVNVERATYGKSETFRAIGNILEHILPKYKYASIPELNAVLNLYNIHANTGDEGSRLEKYRGLQYHFIGPDGSPIGVPIKASLFHNKPTLKILEKRFLFNKTARNKYKKQLKNSIDFALKSKSVITVNDLQSALKKKAIQVVPRINKDGLIYGITFVDHNTKCVFNGRSLGPEYGYKAISERMNNPHIATEKFTITAQSPGVKFPNPPKESPDLHHGQPSFPISTTHQQGVFDILFRTEHSDEPVPYPLRAKKKKRKKKQNE